MWPGACFGVIFKFTVERRICFRCLNFSNSLMVLEMCLLHVLFAHKKTDLGVISVCMFARS